MELTDGDWLPVGKIPKGKSSNVYTITAASGNVTVSVSPNGTDALGVPLTEITALAAPFAFDLVLSKSMSVKQDGGTSVILK